MPFTPITRENGPANVIMLFYYIDVVNRNKDGKLFTLWSTDRSVPWDVTSSVAQVPRHTRS